MALNIFVPMTAVSAVTANPAAANPTDAMPLMMALTVPCQESEVYSRISYQVRYPKPAV